MTIDKGVDSMQYHSHFQRILCSFVCASAHFICVHNDFNRNTWLSYYYLMLFRMLDAHHFLLLILLSRSFKAYIVSVVVNV